jgi:large subunit ribosomal protein L29
MKVTEQLSDLRGRTADDLAGRAREIDEQVFRLRVQKSMGQPESGNKIRPLRRELARIQTVLAEKARERGSE